MTGLELYEHISRLADTLEKRQKGALAFVLASHEIHQAVFYSSAENLAAKIEEAGEKILADVKSMDRSFRLRNRARRFEKRMAALCKKYPHWEKTEGANHE